MLDYNKEEYKRFIEDRKALEARVHEVFNIRRGYLPQEEAIDSIDYYDDTIEVVSYGYCCGDRNTEYCTFPFEYLAKSDEEIHKLFAQEKAVLEQRAQKEKADREAKEKQQQEEREQKQLVTLLKKFVADQRPLPPEFAKVLNDNYWSLLLGGEHDKRK